MERLDRAGVPFAPINKPIDLVDDPHLLAGGGLLDVTLSDGSTIKLPALPLEFDAQKTRLRKDLPAPGTGGLAHLDTLGIAPETISALAKDGLLLAD
jgi:crotonobetainyl-CoA:carnitine CoA-transferase CaiB-like acyl-CoA transferase